MGDIPLKDAVDDWLKVGYETGLDARRLEEKIAAIINPDAFNKDVEFAGNGWLSGYQVKVHARAVAIIKAREIIEVLRKEAL